MVLRIALYGSAWFFATCAIDAVGYLWGFLIAVVLGMAAGVLAEGLDQ